MEKDDKKIEDLVNKLMADDSLESAPLEFTKSVMSKVEALSESKPIVYKPLIPKYIWVLIAASFAGLVAYVFSSKSSESSSFTERYNIPEVSFNLFESVPFDFTSTLMYATVLLAIMVCIQIPLLKQYFSQRLSY